MGTTEEAGNPLPPEREREPQQQQPAKKPQIGCFVQTRHMTSLKHEE